MRGNRGLVIIALVLIVVVVIAGGAYYYMTQMAGSPEPAVEATPVAPPVETTEIVVAVQTIPRGMLVSVEDNAIVLQEWPVDSLPPEYYTALEEVDGKYARMEIPRGMPVLPEMLGRPGGMLSVSGSAAALFEPDDRVAYAIPMDMQGAIGWAIQPGDRVDVLAALNMVPRYTDFLESGVNQFTYLATGGEESAGTQSSPFGKFEMLPNGQWAAIHPLEAPVTPEPMLMVQMTVQDAVVWHVGTWEEDQPATAPAQAADTATEGGALGGAIAPQAAPTPVPVAEPVNNIELVTLLVTRQDALILKYLHEMGADLDLALRPAGVTGTVLDTQPIWFRFIVDKYQLPDTMPDDPVAPAAIHPPLEALPEPTPTPEP